MSCNEFRVGRGAAPLRTGVDAVALRQPVHRVRADVVAKPVIDVVVGLDDPDDESAYLPALAADGWDLRVREPGHRCLRGAVRDLAVNLHCYADDSREIVRYLALRDRLRIHPDERACYAAHKRSLAGREWADMNLYADAKGPVIEEILARADVPPR